LLLSFALEYAIKKVQVNQSGMKLNGTNQILFYADGVIVRKPTYYKKNAEPFVVASTENGLAVNADKTKYMVMARGQNAGRTHNVKTDNSLERVE
jgi:hypothetical protein